MANILELAKKMGISAAPSGVENKTIHSAKRRPWLEDEKGQDAELSRGELKNPESLTVKAEKLEKSAKKWGKLEERTDRHLARIKTKAVQPTEDAGTTNVQGNDKTGTERVQNRRAPSYTTFLCLPPRMTPRMILNQIRANAFQIEKEWFSRIDSFEAIEKIQKDSNHLRKTVSRLKEEGWFQVLEASGAGYRLLKIDPKIFGLEN